MNMSQVAGESGSNFRDSADAENKGSCRRPLSVLGTSH